MSSFHQLLGTQASDSSALIKQRYKLLSTRVHPDKGGSRALMHLVRHAYDEIQAGRGDNEIAFSAQSCPSCAQYKQQIQALKNEIIRLRQHETKAATSVADDAIASKNKAQLTRKLLVLEAEFAALNRKYQYLLTKHTQLDAAHAANEAALQSLNASMARKPVFKRRTVASISLSLGLLFGLMIGVLFGDKQKSKLAPQRAVSAPQPSISASPPPEMEQFAIIAPSAPSTPERQYNLTSTDPIQLPKIALFDITGRWVLGHYIETGAPYIAIKSPTGDYMLTDCSGDFFFYLNQPQRPLSVAANLLYLYPHQHFYIYQLPYGQGASVQSWRQSRKIKIQDAYFTNLHFEQRFKELTERCKTGSQK